MYRLRQHKNLTLEKWSRYPRGQQVLMIANELNRAGNWINKMATEEVNNCYERALELTDLTTSDGKWQGHARRELRRFRQMLAIQYINPEKDATVNRQLYILLIQTVPAAWNLLRPSANPVGVVKTED